MSSHRGGLCVYVKYNINAVLLADTYLPNFNTFEHAELKTVNYKNDITFIFSVCRSPNGPILDFINEFVTHLNIILQYTLNSKFAAVLMGNFNINLHSYLIADVAPYVI